MAEPHHGEVSLLLGDGQAIVRLRGAVLPAQRDAVLGIARQAFACRPPRLSLDLRDATLAPAVTQVLAHVAAAAPRAGMELCILGDADVVAALEAAAPAAPAVAGPSGSGGGGRA